MHQPRTAKLLALKERLNVVEGHLPTYEDREWAIVFEIATVLEEFIEMALRQEL